MGNTITYEQYLTLKGLDYIAKDYNKQLNMLVDHVQAITKEEDDCGHSCDFVYGSRDLDSMLKILEIKVDEPSGDKPLQLKAEKNSGESKDA